jgi:hypothetical protein
MPLGGTSKDLINSYINFVAKPTIIILFFNIILIIILKEINIYLILKK